MSRPSRLAAAGATTLALVFGLAAPAAAQAHAGVRAGLSSDPTQFYFGAHVETAPLFDRVTFRPNAELGVGNNLTLLAANLEFVYSMSARKQPWRVYLGGGPALLIFSGDGPRPGNGRGSLEGGFNVVLGAQHKRGLLTEIKVGFANSPRVKFGVGYAFK